MKRFVSLLSLAGVLSCQQAEVKTTCYVCDIYSTTASPSTHQTKEFCDKEEMDRFIQDVKNRSETSFVNCRNK